MAAEYLHINYENPDVRQVQHVADRLKEGALVIYPTDTVYGIGCDIFNQKAIERVAHLKGLKKGEAHFSFICHDLSHISEYCRQLDNTVFKVMKRVLPGPYTFILKASSKVPKLLLTKRKTVGIRVPDNNIIRSIVRELGNPVITTSVKDSDEVLEYSTEPDIIYERYKDQVDIVIDGGYGNVVPSTVLDCTEADIELIREGMGEVDSILS